MRRLGSVLSISRLLTLLACAISLAGVSACGTASRTATTTPTATPTPGASPPVERTATPATAAAPAAAATTRLALELLPRLGPADANAVASPLSIETALAMVDQGAQRSTAAQIGQVLGVSAPAGLAGANRDLAATLRPAGAGAPTLQEANSVWIQRGLPLRGAFTRTLSRDFASTPQTVDFAADPDAAAERIDAWIAEHTGGRIRDLLGPGSLSSRTDLVLADAVLFHARWATPFDPGLTAQAPFHPAAGPVVRVPFMTFAGPVRLPVAVSGQETAISLPYRDSNLSLLAVMPAAGTLAKVQVGLSPAGLARIVGMLKPQTVGVRFPRLSLSMSIGLDGVLSALGMPVAFTAGADFAGISPEPLQISTVRHAARLDVDEAGTVAAAATAIGLSPTAVEAPPATSITFDRPFLLFLRDRATGAILFAARVTDPAAD